MRITIDTDGSKEIMLHDDVSEEESLQPLDGGAPDDALLEALNEPMGARDEQESSREESDAGRPPDWLQGILGAE